MEQGFGPDIIPLEIDMFPMESDNFLMEREFFHMKSDLVSMESGVVPMESDIFPMESTIDPQVSERKYENDPLLKAFEIMEIIGRYRTMVPATASDRTSDGNIMFLSKMWSQIRAKQPIRMILPAFPFKSPNQGNKTLGSLPDKGEEICLAHLNGLCAAISDVYEYGAKLTIVSDGLVYNGKSRRKYS